MSDFREQLFPYLPPERFSTFSCGHVVPKEHVSTFAVTKGPTGIPFNFTFERRKDERLVRPSPSSSSLSFAPSLTDVDAPAARRARPGDLQHLGGGAQGCRRLRAVLRLPPPCSGPVGEERHDRAPRRQEAGAHRLSLSVRLLLMLTLAFRRRSGSRRRRPTSTSSCGSLRRATPSTPRCVLLTCPRHLVLLTHRLRRLGPCPSCRAASFSPSSAPSSPRALTLPTTWLAVRPPRPLSLVPRHALSHCAPSRRSRHRLRCGCPSSRPSFPPSLAHELTRPLALSLAGIPYPNSQSAELKERMAYLKSAGRSSRPAGAPDAGQVLCASRSLSLCLFPHPASPHALLALAHRSEPRLSCRQPVYRCAARTSPPCLRRPTRSLFFLALAPRLPRVQVGPSAALVTGPRLSSSTSGTRSRPRRRSCRAGSATTSRARRRLARSSRAWRGSAGRDGQRRRRAREAEEAYRRVVVNLSCSRPSSRRSGQVGS